MKCPHCHKNKAIEDKIYGILPCQSCQKREEGQRIHKRYQFASLFKSYRVQSERDTGAKDLIQPYERGKANPEFFRAYPNLAKTYGVEKELEKL